MPFQSKAQARFMFAKHPKIAKEFASKTKSIKALPEKKKMKTKTPKKTKITMRPGKTYEQSLAIHKRMKKLPK